MGNRTSTPPAVPLHTVPASYDDDLVMRCFPHRYRRVGTPHEYLTNIGIEAIVEYISKGHLLIDVAEAVNVPLMVLRRWVEEEGYLNTIEEAETLSAEGYLAEGMRRLRNATCEFELRRAKEMIRHAQYMASKKNKPTYGEQANRGPTAPVTYVFNVAGRTVSPNAPGAPVARVIDASCNRVERVEEVEDASVEVDLHSLYANAVAAPVENIMYPRARGGMLDHLWNGPDGPPARLYGLVEREDGTHAMHELALIAARPANPTAENPDMGPFYDIVDENVPLYEVEDTDR